jgi:hypothetical protein
MKLNTKAGIEIEVDEKLLTEVEAAYQAASGSWVGFDWTYLVPPEGGNRGSSAYDIDGLDLDDPATSDRWITFLLEDCPDMPRNQASEHVEVALDEAREYVAQVERDASAAEDAAKCAIEAVRDGKLDLAAEYAEEASRLERTYGDDPTWGDFRRAVIALFDEEAD